MRTINTALFFLMLGICPALTKADDVKRVADNTAKSHMTETTGDARFQKMINEAVDVYSTLGKDAHNQLPTSVRKNARCVVVLPNVTTAALVVGGTHGDGLASCKTQTGAWSQPAAISLTGGSIGLQAGVKSADILLFVVNKEAENALKLGSMKLGADASVVAGNFDESFNNSNAGVVAYSRSEGVYAGASLTGTKLGKDNDEINRYYGKNVSYLALLDGKDTPSTSVSTSKLTSLFPSEN
jgi:lipid-binding SYLF domain-containing protein